jgi:hypothetical protein
MLFLLDYFFGTVEDGLKDGTPLELEPYRESAEEPAVLPRTGI